MSLFYQVIEKALNAIPPKRMALKFQALRVAVSREARILIILSMFFNLVGCGGYYTYDVYFGPEESDGWRISWANSRISSFSCSGHTVIFPSTVTYSRKTADAVLGVPVSSDSETIKRENVTASLGLQLKYLDTPPAICSINDVQIQLAEDGSEIKPTTANSYYKLNESEYFCGYIFDIEQSSVEKYSVIILSEKIGCDSPRLNVKRKSEYRYGASPW